ncbi:MAG: response regulator [Burkholderiales bacterium]|nr:response regulator [Burkholderiales bacterium]
MFDGNIRTLQRIAAKMQRVLIVDPNTAAVRLLADQLRHVGNVQIFHATSIEAGWGMARTVDPMLVFVEHASSGCDGQALARKIRRSDLACRENPIIMCTSEATAEAIFGARDAGIHEFMRKPFTIKDLERRLEAVTLKPRDWVEAVQYVGPDRRRFNSAEYKGPRKRKADASGAPAARLSQALRIVKSAAQALDSDPAQARRALAAQAFSRSSSYSSKLRSFWSSMVVNLLKLSFLLASSRLEPVRRIVRSLPIRFSRKISRSPP